jgi:RHS repeat-associated protein
LWALRTHNGNAWVCGANWLWTLLASFRYDSVGNGTDTGGSYTTGKRITGFAGCTYTTHFDGNETQRNCPGETVTFSWSAEGRLTAITVNGQSVAFEYDAAGRLLRKSVGGVVQRHFLWEGASLLAELDGAATAKQAEYSYYPGLDNPHALIVGATQYFAHTDGLGNVIALTDTFKNVQRTYAYGPWGALTGGTDYAGFAGKERARFKGALWLGPEVEVYYMRARWYEPKTGRFLSEDPIGLKGGINPYTFAAGDPVNGSDPLGLDDEEDPCPEGFELVAVTEIDYGDGTGVILHRCVNAAGEVRVVSVHVVAPITVTGYQYRDVLQRAGDFAAGFGDMLSLSLTRLGREYQGYAFAPGVGVVDLGCQYCVDYSSTAYAAGQLATLPLAAADFATGAVYALRGTALFTRGTGLLNSNRYLRLGWGWNQNRQIEVMRLAIGNRRAPIHGHLDLW